MIFGRKNRAATTVDETGADEVGDKSTDTEVDSADDVEAAAQDAAPDDADAPSEPGTEDENDEEADAGDGADAEDEELDHDDDGDVRADGPFDVTEVDLAGDGIERLPLGPMTITPFDGMGIQFQGNPETQEIYSVLVMHENSGLQLELFAAPTSSGLSTELREDTLEEAQQGGGNAEVTNGPFGREIKRVLPMEGAEGEQLFHVSRIWLVDGPRWLLRGTLMGQAALVEGEQEPSDIFVEFFRNIVVHRDDNPRVPGELLTLTLPEMPGAQG